MKRGLLLFLIVFLLFPFIAQAVICSDLPEYSGRVCRILNNIAGALYIIGAGTALIVILIGGITIMTAAGSEDKINKGKKILFIGLIGTAILLCAGFLLDLLAEFLWPLVAP